MAFKQGNRVTIGRAADFSAPMGVDAGLVNNRAYGDREGNYHGPLKDVGSHHIVILRGGRRAVFHTDELTSVP